MKIKYDIADEVYIIRPWWLRGESAWKVHEDPSTIRKIEVNKDLDGVRYSLCSSPNDYREGGIFLTKKEADKECLRLNKEYLIYIKKELQL